MAIAAFITGVSGASLSAAERRFLIEKQPWGLILFARNIETPDQVRRLVNDFRTSVGRDDAPVLIDQEGGRVRRLRPPHWAEMPAAGDIAALYETAPRAGIRAAWLSGRLIGEDLNQLGINVDCFPMIDLRFEGAHDIVGDRAYGGSPDQVIALASAAADGLRRAGVAAIIKHIPGHGRALADSHLELPVVGATHAALRENDFLPFKALRALPMAMTAHVVYADIDAGAPATTSKRIINAIIRDEIGFDGLLMTDDLSMKALSGDFATRTNAAFAAGCDIALHCNGNMDEMAAIASATPVLRGDRLQRAQRALAWPDRAEVDCKALRREFESLMGLDTVAVV